ncbi:MAG: hypothetical protein V9G24_15395 [Rhodoblastus sp.]
MAEYQPSRDWKEVVMPDEGARHEAFAALLTSIQSKRRAKYGEGRALHRKGLLALPARLSVLPDLPDYCRYGLFAKPGDYEARVRLSNGGMDIQSNAKPDIRGFAISALGVSGPGALGGDTARQDFLLINQDTFSSPTSEEFMSLVEAASRGQAAILTSFIRNFGVLGGLSRLRRLAGVLAKPFHGFAGGRFNSVAPISCGPYAVRVLLDPCEAHSRGQADAVEDMRTLLSKGPVAYDLKLQFYVDDRLTPIEDPTQAWPVDKTPIATVARLLVLPEAEAPEGFSAEVERAAFDPWAALAEHRPLGEIMRARKVAYFASQQARRAA